MFGGWSACDDGGPAFVNASVANDNQCASSWVCGCKANANSTHRHARVDAKDSDRKEGANENVGAGSRQSNRRNN